MSLKLEIVFQRPSLQDQLAFCFLTSLYGRGPSMRNLTAEGRAMGPGCAAGGTELSQSPDLQSG